MPCQIPLVLIEKIIDQLTEETVWKKRTWVEAAIPNCKETVATEVCFQKIMTQTRLYYLYIGLGTDNYSWKENMRVNLFICTDTNPLLLDDRTFTKRDYPHPYEKLKELFELAKDQIAGLSSDPSHLEFTTAVLGWKP